jgi:hypothetical protein
MNQPTNLLDGLHQWLARYDEMHAQHTASMAEHQGQDGKEPKNYAAYDEQRFTNALEATEFLNGLVAHVRPLVQPPAPGGPSKRTFDPTTTSGAAVAGLFRTWCRLRGDDPEGEVDGGDFVTAASEMFTELGLNVGGPASQVDPAADQHVYTVFGLRWDHADSLLVAGVLPGEHAEAVVILDDAEEGFGRWAETFTADSAQAAADAARRQVEDYTDEPFAEITGAYPEPLLDALRGALNDWFEDHPEHPRPALVEFDVTYTHPEGAAWSDWGPTFHYASDPEREERKDIPVEQVMTGVDFTGTRVADALVELDEEERPTNGETLRVVPRPSA